jgi:hypothetical protein
VPFRKRDQPDLERIVQELRRIADLLERMGQQGEELGSHPDLRQIGARFARIADTLQKGVDAGKLSRAQLFSVARNFTAVGTALERAQERRAGR